MNLRSNVLNPVAGHYRFKRNLGSEKNLKKNSSNKKYPSIFPSQLILWGMALSLEPSPSKSSEDRCMRCQVFISAEWNLYLWFFVSREGILNLLDHICFLEGCSGLWVLWYGEFRIYQNLNDRNSQKWEMLTILMISQIGQPIWMGRIKLFHKTHSTDKIYFF